MKKFKNLAIAGVGVLLGLASFSTAIANEANVLDGEALLITSGDPGDPLYANAGENYRNGVGSIFVEFASTSPFGFLCTASVIGERHVLTAAHCMRNTTESGDPDTIVNVFVVLPGVLPGGGNYVALASGFAVNPLFDIFSPFAGAFAPGDVAIIEMPGNFPANVEQYEIYRDADEFFEETRHYGHGRSGKGNKGATGGADFFIARTGLNQYEQTLGAFFGPPFEQLLHDFDSGGSKHNAMDWWFSPGRCSPENVNNPPQAQDGQCTTFKSGSYPDFKGFGKLEVGIAPGDSGGPGFIDGKIAGVHSFGFTHFCEGVTNGTDFSCGLDSSYGEMSGDARVSASAWWIDGTVAGDEGFPITSIPELVPAAASAVSETGIELSAGGKFLMGNSFSRRLHATVSFEDVKEKFGLE